MSKISYIKYIFFYLGSYLKKKKKAKCFGGSKDPPSSELGFPKVCPGLIKLEGSGGVPML